MSLQENFRYYEPSVTQTLKSDQWQMEFLDKKLVTWYDLGDFGPNIQKGNNFNNSRRVRGDLGCLVIKNVFLFVYQRSKIEDSLVS